MSSISCQSEKLIHSQNTGLLEKNSKLSRLINLLLSIEDNSKPTDGELVNQGGFKIYTDSLNNHMTQATLIAADLCKSGVKCVVTNDQVAKDLAKRTSVAYPLAETKGSLITQPFAIASLLAREANASQFIGKTPFQASQVEQFICVAVSSIQPASTLVESVVFGHCKASEKLA